MLSPTLPTHQPFSTTTKILMALFLGIALSLASFTAGLYTKNRETPVHKAQKTTSDAVTMTRVNRENILKERWESPSKTKSLRYNYDSDSDEYRLFLFDGTRDRQIGRLNEAIAHLDVTWSPDEQYVVVEDPGDINRIFCIGGKDISCTSETVFISYQGTMSTYWSDPSTAYLSYNQTGYDVISKLEFNAENGLPKETILYKEPWHRFFAYYPVSVSPNGRYLLLGFAYEGPTTLHYLDLQTGQFKDLARNKMMYVIGDTPNYTWNGTVITFQAAEVDSEGNSDIYDDQHRVRPELIKEHRVDLRALR